MIEVNQQTKSDWWVVAVRGRADSLAAEELESKLCAAVEQNARVAADFSGLDYISSCGLRAVLQAARAAQARNSRFIVCSMSARVKKVFDISGLHQVLELHGELPC
jgi:anti-sigma B factor antagonist